tara:strand:+ start:1140 stop:2285 length:1146 start_codon:yes stop_codon:yes gene_type:complete
MNKIILTSFSYASNLMFFNGLMVILTIFGYSSLAAEIGLTYSLIASVNLIFSYNLKNQILLDGNRSLASQVYSFRIFLSLVVFIILFLILENYNLNFFSEILIISTSIIIFQNWLIEILLILYEVEKKYKFFKYYNIYNLINFLILIINLHIFQNKFLLEILFYIIILNSFIIIKNNLNHKLIKYNFLKLFNKISKVFALTSSISVILSVLFWRVFIFFNFSKEVAGILFSSFAIGSFIGTIFSTSIAPSIIKKKAKYKAYLDIYFILVLFFCFFVFYLSGNFVNFNIELSKNSFLFINCSLLSILGSAIMLFAIIRRINFYNLKKYRNKIYILDIINSLVIAFIPVILFYINMNLIIFSYFLAAFFSLILFSKFLLNEKT